MFGYYIPNEIIVKEMNKAGYLLRKDFDFLPEQSFTIFYIKYKFERIVVCYN